MDRRAATLAASLQEYEYFGDQNPIPSDIAYDSRKVSAGSLFVCLRGEFHDGHAFAPEAVRNGATVLLCERHLTVLADTPQIVVPNSRRAMGQIAAAFYGHPSEQMPLLGVTGTNGKTTTTHLIKSILDSDGYNTGLIGTIAHRIGKQDIAAARTTPESPDIQRLMADMLAQGSRACAMEVSSHGISLHRTEGCSFSVGLFTNLSQDHLDYHATFDEYCNTKVQLFETLRERAIVNLDDPYAEAFISASSAPVYTYGLKARDADFVANDVRVHPDGVEYMARTPTGTFRVRLALTGLFNVYNSLGAIAVAYHMGVTPDKMVESLARVKVPGRFESIKQGQPFSVIVDYAHTPDGLENVLSTAREVADGRVIVLFGAGGDRDPGKRPQMGKIAAKHADHVIVTSDNPRSEDPEVICSQIEVGVKEAGMTAREYTVIVDRREAIRHAIAQAEQGDLVLIAGKGHETYQEFNGTRIHFDDREEAVLALEERFGSAKAHTH